MCESSFIYLFIFGQSTVINCIFNVFRYIHPVESTTPHPHNNANTSDQVHVTTPVLPASTSVDRHIISKAHEYDAKSDETSNPTKTSSTVPVATDDSASHQIESETHHTHNSQTKDSVLPASSIEISHSNQQVVESTIDPPTEKNKGDQIADPFYSIIPTVQPSTVNPPASENPPATTSAPASIDPTNTQADTTNTVPAISNADTLNPVPPINSEEITQTSTTNTDSTGQFNNHSNITTRVSDEAIKSEPNAPNTAATAQPYNHSNEDTPISDAAIKSDQSRSSENVTNIDSTVQPDCALCT